MKIKSIPGGVTAAAGFRAACCAAGIKYRGRTDMAMLASDRPCAVAGTFTSNIVKAAPVVWDRDIVQGAKTAQAVVVNAGIANAATGPAGMEMCRRTAEYTGKALGIPAEYVLLGSTGVIGPNLPIDRITGGVAAMVPALSDSLDPDDPAYTETFRDAVKYALNHEEKLRRFLDDPMIPIDNGFCLSAGITYPHLLPEGRINTASTAKRCA